MDASGRRAVAIAMTTQAVAIGTTFGSFSLFVQPLERAFEAARWQVSLGPALLVMALAVGGMTIGPILDRGAIRPVLLTAAAAHALTLLLASRASSLLELGALCFLLGLSVPPLGPLGGSTLVGRAVGDGRGRALGIMNMGAPLGGLAFAALTGVILESWGWRSTLQLFAGISAAVNIPAALCVPRLVVNASADAEEEPDAGWTMQELARSPAFLLLGLVFALGTGVGAGWTSQMAPYLDGLGMSVRGAASVVAISGGIAVVGTLALGALADRVSAARLLSGALAIGCFCWIAYATEASLTLAVMAALLLGILMGGFMPLYTHLVAERFGTASLGRALGLTNLLMLPVSAASGPLAAAAHDVSGSYRAALLGFILLYVIAIYCLAASGKRLGANGKAR